MPKPSVPVLSSRIVCFRGSKAFALRWGLVRSHAYLLLRRMLPPPPREDPLGWIEGPLKRDAAPTDANEPVILCIAASETFIKLTRRPFADDMDVDTAFVKDQGIFLRSWLARMLGSRPNICRLTVRMGLLTWVKAGSCSEKVRQGRINCWLRTPIMPFLS